MTLVRDLLAAGTTRSIEFFPPKTPEAEQEFHVALAELAPLRPSFASVTYGALGSTRQRTRDLVVRMNADHQFPTMAHLTCVGHTRAEIGALLDDYARAGVRNILALGGDPPSDGSEAGGDFRYAMELVELVRDHPGDFCVGVAAHPEVHPRSPDRAHDRRHLAAKLGAADFAMTQFFFSPELYEDLLEELAALGCHRPVVPGVMPFVSVAGLTRMARMNGTAIPPALAARLGDVSAEDVVAIGVETAVSLCEELLRRGAPGLHLYALNRSRSLREIWDALDRDVARGPR